MQAGRTGSSLLAALGQAQLVAGSARVGPEPAPVQKPPAITPHPGAQPAPPRPWRAARMPSGGGPGGHRRSLAATLIKHKAAGDSNFSPRAGESRDLTKTPPRPGISLRDYQRSSSPSSRLRPGTGRCVARTPTSLQAASGPPLRGHVRLWRTLVPALWPQRWSHPHSSRRGHGDGSAILGVRPAPDQLLGRSRPFPRARGFRNESRYDPYFEGSPFHEVSGCFITFHEH